MSFVTCPACGRGHDCTLEPPATLGIFTILPFTTTGAAPSGIPVQVPLSTTATSYAWPPAINGCSVCGGSLSDGRPVQRGITPELDCHVDCKPGPA